MKVVRVIMRDLRKRPIKAAVREETSPVEVIAERGPIDWLPLHGQRVGEETPIELPRDFLLSRDSLEALDRAE